MRARIGSKRAPTVAVILVTWLLSLSAHAGLLYAIMDRWFGDDALGEAPLMVVEIIFEAEATVAASEEQATAPTEPAPIAHLEPNTLPERLQADETLFEPLPIEEPEIAENPDIVEEPEIAEAEVIEDEAPLRLDVMPVRKPERLIAELSKNPSNTGVTRELETLKGKPPPTPDRIAGPQTQLAKASPGQAGREATIDERYQRMLLSHVERYKRYPKLAKRARLEGSARLVLAIDQRGSLISAVITNSSGHGILDDEALAVARRADPYPAPPDQAAPTFDFSVTLRFEL